MKDDLTGGSNAEKKKYCVWMTLAQYGMVYVEAENPEKAKDEAMRLYMEKRVDWNDEEITDLTVEES